MSSSSIIIIDHPSKPTILYALLCHHHDKLYCHHLKHLYCYSCIMIIVMFVFILAFITINELTSYFSVFFRCCYQYKCQVNCLFSNISQYSVEFPSIQMPGTSWLAHDLNFAPNFQHNCETLFDPQTKTLNI